LNEQVSQLSSDTSVEQDAKKQEVSLQFNAANALKLAVSIAELFRSLLVERTPPSTAHPKDTGEAKSAFEGVTMRATIPGFC